MLKFLERLQAMTDDELIESLIGCDENVLVIVQHEWNRRHPEDRIPLHKEKAHASQK